MTEEQVQVINALLQQTKDLKSTIVAHQYNIIVQEAALLELNEAMRKLEHNILSTKTSVLLALEEIEELNIVITLLLNKSIGDKS